MNRSTLIVVAVLSCMAAACSDGEERAATPSPGPLASGQAPAGDAVVAFGMTRTQLEEADLRSADNRELGDIEGVVTDAGGAATHLVVELEGPGDQRKVVPLADLRSRQTADARDGDLATDLTAAQLEALPDWIPPAR